MSKLVLNRNNGSADEYGHLLALSDLLTGDVITGLNVVAATSPNMTVIVQAGSAGITTGTSPASYRYWVKIDTTTGSPAGEVVTIATAPASNSRIDTIVAYVDLSVTATTTTANNPNNMLKLAAVAGTVAASPSAPSNAAIQAAIGASNPYIKLANVTVGTSVTQINSGNITDIRTLASLLPTTLADSSVTPKKIDSTTFTHLRYHLATGIGSPATGATIPYDTKDYDNLNEFSTSTHLFTAKNAGLYLIIARYQFGAGGIGTTETAEIDIQQNGSTVLPSDKMNGSGDANRLVRPIVVGTLSLAVSDTIKAIHNGSNGIRDITAGNYTFIEIHRIG